MHHLLYSTENKTVITEVDFAISETFADGVYSSCKDVSMPSTNDKAMSIMCGPWGTFYCSPHRWFTYMGSPSNGFAPFLISYNMINDTKEDRQFKKDIVTCDQKPTVSRVLQVTFVRRYSNYSLQLISLVFV